jgi:UDP-3-O-[3-hydroxymyristoyl] glucosamine N-acyltransferase
MQEGIGKYCIFDDPDTIEIGSDVFIGNYVHIRPDVSIGNWSHIRDHCFIAEGVEIGHNTRRRGDRAQHENLPVLQHRSMDKDRQ